MVRRRRRTSKNHLQVRVVPPQLGIRGPGVLVCVSRRGRLGWLHEFSRQSSFLLAEAFQREVNRMLLVGIQGFDWKSTCRTKNRRPGWFERAGGRLDEFGQWVNRRCVVPLRRFVKWLVRVLETAVETVMAVAKASGEAVAQNQTVKTIAAGARRLPTSQTGRYTCGSGMNAWDCW
jgi:hypothetical protein